MTNDEQLSREMERMTDTEVAAYFENAEPATALVPVGSMEQHGPHLCLGTDALIPEEVSRRIAPDLDALVAPRVNYGVSDDHVGFSGVAYLTQETLIDVLHDVAYSLCEAGFDDVVFLNGHYTNEAPIKVACNKVMRELPADKHVYGFPYWMALGFEEMAEYLSFEEGWHANVGETAAVLAIDEELVDMDEAVAEYPEMSMDVPNPATLMDSTFFGPSTMFRALETGVWGDPTEATAERGEEYYEMITDAVATLITTFQTEREKTYMRDRPTEEELF
ncbi:creatininase family protein [Halobacteria archaeon AArc-dxtr1]|nr:creatininase family protein [Halobacteria archaeon AArc-dxtr1]